MIVLTVISFNGTPDSQAPSASFDEMGGTIGRADTNQLVLPDPDRAISRVHAQVVFRNGQYAIVDRGSNPISVNGRSVGHGKEAPLAEGDKLQIGGYVLVAKLGAAASSAAPHDPFADLLGPAKAAAPASASANPTARGQAAAAGRPAAPVADPFAAFGLGAPLAPGAAAPAAAPAGGAVRPGSIPDDWNPFAGNAAPAAGFADPFGNNTAFGNGQAPSSRAGGGGSGGNGGNGGHFGLDVGAAAEAPLVTGIGGLASESSLDQLFGLKPGGGGDPFAGSALSEAMAAPNMAASADPMRSLGSAPLASGAAAPDNLSDLQRPFMSAAPQSAPRAPEPVARAAAIAPSPVAMPQAAPPPAPLPSPALLPEDFGLTPISGMVQARAAPAVLAAPAAPFAPPASVATGAAPAAAADAGGVPAGAVLSWENGDDDRTVYRPATRKAVAAVAAAVAARAPATTALSGMAAPAAAAPAMPVAPVAPFMSMVSPAPVAAALPAAPASATTSATTTATPSATTEAQSLLAAFCEGLGPMAAQPGVLSPALLRLAGQLVLQMRQMQQLTGAAPLSPPIAPPITAPIAADDATRAPAPRATP